MKKKAFTILELIIVIVIMGILSIVLMNDNEDYDNVDQNYRALKKDLLYTKQINLHHDFFISTDNTWTSKTDCLELVSNTNYNLNNNGVLLADINLEAKDYNITTKSEITFEDSTITPITKICFDHLGRPYKNDLTLANIMQEDINITIQTKTGDYNRAIQIIPITGYIK